MVLLLSVEVLLLVLSKHNKLGEETLRSLQVVWMTLKSPLWDQELACTI